MKNESTNILKIEESMDVVAAGKTRERETNAPDQFKAPRAAEEREPNAPCQRKTAEDARTRETNVSEEEAAAVRRDGGLLTIADQQLRRENSAASRPPSRTRLRHVPPRTRPRRRDLANLSGPRRFYSRPT